MKLRDFSGFRKKTIIRLNRIDNPFNRVYVFTFDKPDGMEWRPGEHGIFRISDVQGKKWRAFSIASTPDEGIIRIATRIESNSSPFKARLRDMQRGDSISMRGPFGWFTIQDQWTPIVGIAGGIGITPFRALLASLEEEETRDIHLIYASKDQHLFQKDFEEICEKNPKISVSFVHDREALTTDLMVHAKKYENRAFYYMSGSMKVNQLNRQALKEMGIPTNRMIHDPFLGYGKRG